MVDSIIELFGIAVVMSFAFELKLKIYKKKSISQKGFQEVNHDLDKSSK